MADGAACEKVVPVVDQPYTTYLHGIATSLTYLGNVVELRSDKGRSPDYYLMRATLDGQDVSDLPLY